MTFWRNEPWAKSPSVLLESLESFYRKAIQNGKVIDPAQTTAKRVMIQRAWCPTVNSEKLLNAVKDVELVYVPTGVGPGPGFLFPIRDVSGDIRRLHIRVNDEAANGSRYITLQEKNAFIGPAWVGADDATLARIIKSGQVLVVEGPFDLLAVRSLVPELPSLSPLSKRLTKNHVSYLYMLGVQHIHVLWDADEAGAAATDVTVKRLKSRFRVSPVECPDVDPAACMCLSTKMRRLEVSLQSLIRDEGIPWDAI